MHIDSNRRRGFTLVELLVVMAILAILSAILLPAVRRVRQQAMGVQCLSQLRQNGAGILAYALRWDGVVPFGWSKVEAEDNGNGVSLYWYDFLQGSGLASSGKPDWTKAAIPSEHNIYCPRNKESDDKSPGSYGALNGFDDNPGMKRSNWGISAFMRYIRPSAIRTPADFPLLADATMRVDQWPGRGAREWAPNGHAALSHASARGMVWRAHNNRANVLFADGHAESCDSHRLLRTSAFNNGAANKRGITHWCTEDFKLETKQLP